MAAKAGRCQGRLRLPAPLDLPAASGSDRPGLWLRAGMQAGAGEGGAGAANAAGDCSERCA